MAIRGSILPRTDLGRDRLHHYANAQRQNMGGNLCNRIILHCLDERIASVSQSFHAAFRCARTHYRISFIELPVRHSSFQHRAMESNQAIKNDWCHASSELTPE